MKAAWLVVVILLLAGALFVWVMPSITSQNSSVYTPPVQSFAAPSSTSTWWVGASSTDPSALPNTGVRGAIQVISTPITGCLSFWVSDEVTNDNWGQVGYFICNGSIPDAFYQVWNLNTQTILAGGTVSVSSGTHTFAMYLQSGTTWAYSLDGNVMGTYDMGSSSSSSSYPVYALSEEQASSVFSFPSVTFSTAMQVLQGGSWGSVQTAQSYGTAWGTSGAAQGGGLENDQITVGGSLPALPQGTPLWGIGSSTTSSVISTTATTTVTDSTTSIRTTPTQTTSSTETVTTTLGNHPTTTDTVTTVKSTTTTLSSTTSSKQTLTSTTTVTTSTGFPPATSSGSPAGVGVPSLHYYSN